MRSFDFSSWQALLSTLTGLALITVIGVGVRLLIMATIQQRRERENRQINERLRTLIAAYKTLGGSFTGDLLVDPTHLRDEQRRAVDTAFDAQANVSGLVSIQGSERARRVRDAVEAALSDIILLGTDDHVRLASRAARDLVSGQRVHTAELVVSLRDFVRSALGLGPIPSGLEIPMQGPTRAAAAGGKGKGEAGGDSRQGGGRGGNGGGGAGMGTGGLGLGVGIAAVETEDGRNPQA